MKQQTKLMQGDNIESLKKLPDNSIDSVVTDPPYGLSFMSKKWDYEVPSIDFWREVYRVLKPGGHVLSFGGTRTYHRMVVAIEDAGFEIRDQIQWLYGSGFPKSYNIGKAVDKIEGNEREVVGTQNTADIRGNKLIVTAQGLTDIPRLDLDITKGNSPYEGWGTSLKPANEPICVARKPLSEKSVAENVIKWGTGGINIDGCRIGSEVRTTPVGSDDNRNDETLFGLNKTTHHERVETTEGRFPANIIFDETAAELLDIQSGISESKKGNPRVTKNFNQNAKIGGGQCNVEYNDKGGASRFFYIAKVSKKERNLGLDGFEEKETKGSIGLHSVGGTPTKDNNRIQKNTHPTLKPINLMTYLCRLVTPEGGIVLDPFMGSGSTGISACLEGFRFVGMELDEDYFKIAEARIENYEKYRDLLKK